jgi:hypothetical protein
MKTGRLTFPRPEKELLLQIRKGEWTLNKVELYFAELEAELRATELISPLRKNIDRAKASPIISNAYICPLAFPRPVVDTKETSLCAHVAQSEVPLNPPAQSALLSIRLGRRRYSTKSSVFSANFVLLEHSTASVKRHSIASSGSLPRRKPLDKPGVSR